MNNIIKKVLIVDDSALMRRVFTDVLNEDGRYDVSAQAQDGLEALELVKKTSFDAIILDINMPRMNGIEFLEALKIRKNTTGKQEKVIVVSTDTAEGADVTIRALELGAVDFIQKPQNTLDAKRGEFKENFLSIVATVTEADDKKVYVEPISATVKEIKTVRKPVIPRATEGKNKLVAIACSTGGPNALQHIIPFLPENLAAPVIMVQHMPSGFTNSLAQRLDSLSHVRVSEAKDGDVLENGHVYIAKGGTHMKYDDKVRKCLYFSDEPQREGVKPAANYMYESLMESSFTEIVCVVLTGMGQDGMVGIRNLKTTNNTFVIAQSEETCTVYGMPKAIVNNKLADQVVPLDNIAQEIVNRIGVK